MNPYTILGIPEDSGEADVRSAFAQKSTTCSPTEYAELHLAYKQALAAAQQKAKMQRAQDTTAQKARAEKQPEVLPKAIPFVESAPQPDVPATKHTTPASGIQPFARSTTIEALREGFFADAVALYNDTGRAFLPANWQALFAGVENTPLLPDATFAWQFIHFFSENGALPREVFRDALEPFIIKWANTHWKDHPLGTELKCTSYPALRADIHEAQPRQANISFRLPPPAKYKIRDPFETYRKRRDVARKSRTFFSSLILFVLFLLLFMLVSIDWDYATEGYGILLFPLIFNTIFGIFMVLEFVSPTRLHAKRQALFIATIGNIRWDNISSMTIQTGPKPGEPLRLEIAFKKPQKHIIKTDDYRYPRSTTPHYNHIKMHSHNTTIHINTLGPEGLAKCRTLQRVWYARPECPYQQPLAALSTGQS